MKSPENIEKDISRSTYTFRNLCASAKALFETAENDNLREIAKIVYDEIQYSDFVSSYSVYEINEKIQTQFFEFENAINMCDEELAKALSTELLKMLVKRNELCKLSKKWQWGASYESQQTNRV